MEKSKQGTLKFIILFFIVTILTISFIYYIISDKKKDMEVTFLNSYGDIKLTEGEDNVLSLGLIVDNFDSNYELKNVQSGTLKFDNDNIEILDYKFVDADIKYKNAKLFYLEIDYTLKVKELDNNSLFEVNNIYINDNIFEIGKLYFFNVPSNYNDFKELTIDKVSAMSSGLGLKDFFTDLSNNTKTNIILKKIDLKHFNKLSPKITLDGKQEKIYDIPNLKSNSITSLNIQFNNKLMNEYDVFYFSPTIEYFDSKDNLRSLYFDYFVSGLMLDKKDFEVLVNKITNTSK